MDSRVIATKLVERPAFTVAGVAVVTSLAGQAADAPAAAARLLTPGFAESFRGRVDPSATYALHADFDPAAGTYRLILGFEVAEGAEQPPGADVLHVPAARYTVFTARGPQPQASIEAWKEIAAWRARPGLVRTGRVSFEVHDLRARREPPEVDIYIPATAG